MEDVGQMSAGRERSRVLSVSRPKALKRSAAAQRPPPSVYTIPPQDFRSLVQQLTGAAPMEHPLHPSRLQRIAPLPLQPIPRHAYPPPPSPTAPQSPNFWAALAREGALSPFSQRHAFNQVLSPLKLSPLAPLTPRDCIWASTESPITATNLMFLADEAAAENEFASYAWDGVQLPPSSPSHSLISPLFQPSSLLPPQMPALPSEIFTATFSADSPLEIGTFAGYDFP